MYFGPLYNCRLENIINVMYVYIMDITDAKQFIKQMNLDMKKYKLLCYTIYYLTGILINKYNICYLYLKNEILEKIKQEHNG